MFPPHTTPSDKARCHMLNRQGSRSINEETAHHPPISPTDSITAEYPMPANVSLRKVAETMYLKDPQYKPRLGEQPATKSNPFTTLAQLRGVKKMLGANPSTYTAGVGDLFSSCFETSSPFLRDLTVFQKLNAKTGAESMPKSLPSSPTSLRRDYKIDKSLEDKVLKSVILAKNNMIDGFVKSNGTEYESSDDSGCGGASGEMVESNLDYDPLKSTGTIKKFKVNSLFSHPLFKNGNVNITNGTDDSTGAMSSDDDAFDTRATQSNTNDALVNIKNDMANKDHFPHILTRRGSSESGFFSSLNEDFSTYKPPLCSCVDKMKTNLKLDAVTMCRCCIYSNGCGGAPICGGNDSSSVLLLGGSSAVSSLCSLDDLELSDSLAKKRNNCHRHLYNNIDTRSVDVGLINRLALDSEINSLIQRNQFANQLLYCKNRTSSIYTDSSDDISSLAGSDSLLWDERTYSSFPNTRSAQIAKIVEYFERKGQSFKPFNVPEQFRPSSAAVAAASARSYSSNGGSGTVGTSSSDCLATEFRSEYPFAGANRKFVDYKSRATAAEYEAFCLELEKRPSQQRIMVCDGAVKSKLQIFDKLPVKQGGQRE